MVKGNWERRAELAAIRRAEEKAKKEARHQKEAERRSNTVDGEEENKSKKSLRKQNFAYIRGLLLSIDSWQTVDDSKGKHIVLDESDVESTVLQNERTSSMLAWLALPAIPLEDNEKVGAESGVEDPVGDAKEKERGDRRSTGAGTGKGKGKGKLHPNSRAKSSSSCQMTATGTGTVEPGGAGLDSRAEAELVGGVIAPSVCSAWFRADACTGKKKCRYPHRGPSLAAYKNVGGYVEVDLDFVRKSTIALAAVPAPGVPAGPASEPGQLGILSERCEERRCEDDPRPLLSLTQEQAKRVRFLTLDKECIYDDAFPEVWQRWWAKHAPKSSETSDIAHRTREQSALESGDVAMLRERAGTLNLLDVVHERDQEIEEEEEEEEEESEEAPACSADGTAAVTVVSGNINKHDRYSKRERGGSTSSYDSAVSAASEKGIKGPGLGLFIQFLLDPPSVASIGACLLQPNAEQIQQQHVMKKKIQKSAFAQILFQHVFPLLHDRDLFGCFQPLCCKTLNSICLLLDEASGGTAGKSVSFRARRKEAFSRVAHLVSKQKKLEKKKKVKQANVRAGNDKKDGFARGGNAC